jgi:hypothetical protein
MMEWYARMESSIPTFTLQEIRAEISLIMKSEGHLKVLEEEGFFEHPASLNHHLNCKGGLALHSLNVYFCLNRLSDQFKLNIPMPVIAKTAILHDLCKLHTIKAGVYARANKEKGIEKGDPKYESDVAFPIGHGDKSVIMGYKLGFAFTDEEIAMIRWHMGNYDYVYKEYQVRATALFPNIRWLQVADQMATAIEDVKDIQIIDDLVEEKEDGPKE